MPEKPRLILSTCGTSLLTNGSAADTRKFLLGTARAGENDLPEDEKGRLNDRAAECSRALAAASLDDVRRLSAELNGLLGLLGDLPPSGRAGRPDRLILAHTDTFQGRLVFEALRAWLEGRGHEVEPLLLVDLSLSSASSTRPALSELARWCEERIPVAQDAGYEVTFNLTGGFKVVQGFLQTVAMLYAVEVVFIWEGSTELIRIPRLPVGPETRWLSGVALLSMRRLGQGDELDASLCAGIPETLLFELDGRCALSVWGDVVWNRLKREVYAAGLLEPVGSSVEYSSSFRKAAAGLREAERIVALNKRIDDLVACFEHGRALSALGYKELKGAGRGSSTHEFRVWSDSARRAYGHFDAQRPSVFIIDALAGHL